MAGFLLALGLIALVGSLLRYVLVDLDVEAARRTIGLLVLNVFLPALVFRVICSMPTGPEMLQIPLVMAIGVGCSSHGRGLHGRTPPAACLMGLRGRGSEDGARMN